MRSLLAGSILVALLVPALAGAEPKVLSADGHSRMMGLLRSYEYQPTADDFVQLGDGARDALVEVALDEAEQPLIRGRAAYALGWFPDEVSRRTLTGLLARPELSDLILRRAIDGLATGFGEDAVSCIAPYLDDERTAVRETAAAALGRIGGAKALRALRRRVARETNDVVRGAFEEAIRRIEGSASNE
ncbi:MAG: HEAT repeat domain-containing protein [Deltaproteobacteria bacterium]|nr:HEAT repeat domain-containing protein [Deltaproteobacteria bacterium]